jgi:ABC-type phosphate/phosphonate transport system permease subunit
MTKINKPEDTQPLTWSRFTFPGSIYKYGTLLFVLVFLTYSLNFMNVSIPKMLGALGGLVGVISERYYPPDLAYVTDPGYLASVVDTLQMSFLGGIAGVFLSIPLAWFSAANVSPNRQILFPIGRMGVISCRAIHETIWTILFVSVLGFGMLAGVSALTMFCIGFAGSHAFRWSKPVPGLHLRSCATGACSFHRNCHLHLGCGLSGSDGCRFLWRRWHGLVSQTQRTTAGKSAGWGNCPIDYRHGPDCRIYLRLAS